MSMAVSPTDSFDKVDNTIARAYVQTMDVHSEYREDVQDSVIDVQQMINILEHSKELEEEDIRQSLQNGFEGIASLANIYEEVYEDIKDVQNSAMLEASEYLREGDMSKEDYEESYEEFESLMDSAETIREVGKNLYQRVVYPTTSNVLAEEENFEELKYIPTSRNSSKYELNVEKVVEAAKKLE